jgi:AcrR family transcriptional regulator
VARVSVDQRRNDLVAAAFRVMSQTGIGQATTRAICAEAGVHQSVFHYSFNSKKELLQELVRVVVVDMTDAAVLVSEVNSEAGSSIRSAFRVLWEQAKAHPDRQLVAYELTTYVMRDPELADLAKWQYEQYFKQAERFAMAIETSADIEWSVPMATLSRMMATAIDGLVLGWLADRDDESAEAALDEFATFFAGLARPKATSKKGRAASRADNAARILGV